MRGRAEILRQSEICLFLIINKKISMSIFHVKVCVSALSYKVMFRCKVDIIYVF